MVYRYSARGKRKGRYIIVTPLSQQGFLRLHTKRELEEEKGGTRSNENKQS